MTHSLYLGQLLVGLFYWHKIKLIDKLLALYLNQSLEILVGKDQVSFVPSRQAFVNI